MKSYKDLLVLGEARQDVSEMRKMVSYLQDLQSRVRSYSSNNSDSVSSVVHDGQLIGEIENIIYLISKNLPRGKNV